MSKENIGDACAYFPAATKGEKSRYVRIGSAFRDGDRISVKIDSLPLGDWGGWINIFPRDRPAANKSSVDDDIPF